MRTTARIISSELCRKMSISRPLSLLVCGVTLATAGAAPAAAQSVIVRNATPGTTIQVQLNEEAARSATADTNGDATVALQMPAHMDEISVRFVVDVCSSQVRVQVVGPGVEPALAGPGCNRNAAREVFIMRGVTTFVVDLDGTSASIHLTQGPAPPSWLGRAQSGQKARRYFLATPPSALLLFAGAGVPRFSNAVNVACGNVTTCSGGAFTGAVAAGAAFWIKNYLGAEITFAKPAQTTATGSGATFRFNSALDSRLMTIVAVAGIPVGPARLYALGGRNYHRATFSTTETINDATIVINDVSQTIKGGTQTFQHKTEGWNWLLGGGLEAWVSKPIAFYIEVQRATLKATDIGAAEGGIDDHAILIMSGIRVRVFR
jgi:hypothetical protein